MSTSGHQRENNVRRRENGDVRIEVEEMEEERKKKKNIGNEIIYGVESSPPWYSCIVFGLQHYLLIIGGTISLPLITTRPMCIEDDEVGKSEVISTNLFVSGAATLLQATFGTRLPIVQGGSFAFLPPLFAIMKLPEWECPDIPAEFVNSTTNITEYKDWRREVWTSRMREIQGAIVVAAIFQLLVGLTGIVGFLLRFIGPLVVAPTICLIGLHLYIAAAQYCAKQWGIAFMTAFLIILFSQYLRNVLVPIPRCTRGKGCSSTKVPIFKMLPVFFAMTITWLFCAILTVSGALPNDKTSIGYGARTDTKLFVLNEASWFRVPYPGQWGLPTVSVAAVLGMLAGVVAGVIESVGDYYACARISEAPPPPTHAVNRGILFEGIGVIVAGFCGTGTGVTSFSENIGAIGITKVASRRVIQAGAIIMVVFGLLGKVGAFFVTIPEPIVGGIFMAVFGMISAVGVSNLQFVDLNSSRNLFVFGFSLFLGLSLPTWVESNSDSIHTGVPILDQIIVVLLSTHMFVGGFMAIILDNTIPGSLEERGIVKWLSQGGGQKAKKLEEVYGFPCGMSCIKKASWTRYLPFCPTYNPSCLTRGKGEEEGEGEGERGRSDSEEREEGVREHQAMGGGPQGVVNLAMDASHEQISPYKMTAC